MPGPTLVSKVNSDYKKVKFLLILGRPQIGLLVYFWDILGKFLIDYQPKGSWAYAFSAKPCLTKPLASLGSVWEANKV